MPATQDVGKENALSVQPCNIYCTNSSISLKKKKNKKNAVFILQDQAQCFGFLWCNTLVMIVIEKG